MAQSLYEDLELDPITLRPLLCPHKLYNRFYEITTLVELLDQKAPCPFTRKPFTVHDVKKPNMFETQFFEIANNISRVSEEEYDNVKRKYVIFVLKHNWNTDSVLTDKSLYQHFSYSGKELLYNIYFYISSFDWVILWILLVLWTIYSGRRRI
jgi:hypothetical protein